MRIPVFVSRVVDPALDERHAGFERAEVAVTAVAEDAVALLVIGPAGHNVDGLDESVFLKRLAVLVHLLGGHLLALLGRNSDVFDREPSGSHHATSLRCGRHGTSLVRVNGTSRLG